MKSEEGLRAAAIRAASATTRLRQVIEDAAEVALEEYRLAIWRGRTITDPMAWVSSVAYRTAKEMSGRVQRRRTESLSQVCASMDALEFQAGETYVQCRGAPRGDETESHAAQLTEFRRLLRRHVAQTLTPKQREAIHLILTNHTFASAARNARTDKSSFRRRFWRAVVKLRSGGGLPKVASNSP